MFAQQRGNRVAVLLAGVLATCFWSPRAYPQEAQSPAGPQDERVPTGLIFAGDAVYASIPEASSPVMGVLPASKDLTSQFPAPGNQGTKQSSCAAWALAYALKTYQEGSERGWSIATDDHIFSPSFLYNQLNRTSDCSGGLTFPEVLNLAHSSGVATLRDFAYNPDSCVAIPSSTIKKSAETFKIGAYRRVNVQDDTEVKSEIAAGVPVLIGLDIDYSFWKLYRADRGKEVYTKFDQQQKKGGHAVVLIGYDDEKKAYKVINSWGNDWGNRGFGWIAYETFHQMVKEGYVIQDDPGHNFAQINGPANLVQSSAPLKANLAIGQPNLQINSPVKDSNGNVFPGIIISVPGQVTGAIGRHLQLVARFLLPNGQMLVAHPLERVYRDATGLVAVGPPEMTITTSPVDLAPFNFSIPYYAITPPTNGQVNHQIAVTIAVYDNSFLIFQTPPESFSFIY